MNSSTRPDRSPFLSASVPGTGADIGTDRPLGRVRAGCALRSATVALGVTSLPAPLLLTLFWATPAWQIVAGSLPGLLFAALGGWSFADRYARACHSPAASISLGIRHALLTCLGAALAFGVLSSQPSEAPRMAFYYLLGTGLSGGLALVPFGGYLLGLWQQRALSTP